MDTELNDDRPATAPEALAAEKLWLVNTGDEIGKTARGNREWKGQIRVIWEAARTEDEPAVLLNLLRYQRARNKNWIEPEDAFTPLSQALGECVDKAGADTTLAMDLIRHLLLYTIRSHTYHAATAEEEQL